MNNYACIGYMILAMKQANLKDKDITKAISEVYSVFDVVSEQEAEQVCFNCKLDESSQIFI